MVCKFPWFLILFVTKGVLSTSDDDSEPLDCNTYRVLNTVSVYRLENKGQWPCRYFFFVHRGCSPRLFCPTFKMGRREDCGFLIRQSKANHKRGSTNEICRKPNYQGNFGTSVFDISVENEGYFECLLTCETYIDETNPVIPEDPFSNSVDEKEPDEVLNESVEIVTEPYPVYSDQDVSDSKSDRSSESVSSLPKSDRVSLRPELQSTSSCQCGKSSTKRIVGGQTTAEGEYPWQTAIKWALATKAFCGGALITKKHVLSAAHCAPKEVMDGIKRVVAVFGAHNISNAEEKSQVTRKIRQITTHPQYNKATYDFDYSIFELQDPVSFNERIEPVCLPGPDEAATLDLHERELDIAGWGKLQTEGKQSQVLQVIRVRSMKNEECLKKYYAGFTISERMLCAWKRNSTGFTVGDTCGGDSGGPLIMRRHGHSSIVGIVSWGMDCASQQYPGVYARVYHQLKWIKEKIPQSERCF